MVFFILPWWCEKERGSHWTIWGQANDSLPTAAWFNALATCHIGWISQMSKVCLFVEHLLNRGPRHSHRVLQASGGHRGVSRQKPWGRIECNGYLAQNIGPAWEALHLGWLMKAAWKRKGKRKTSETGSSRCKCSRTHGKAMCSRNCT